jgi:ribonucleotide monophosphatase NagD (HAD superfamily)
VLPNPDLIYPSGEGFGIAAGSVALMFEGALGLRYPDRTDLRFARLGKPHAAMFAEALRRSGTRNMVMVGDQLEADIGGAQAFGLDSVLVGTGVSTAAFDAGLARLQPTYLMPSLA